MMLKMANYSTNLFVLFLVAMAKKVLTITPAFSELTSSPDTEVPLVTMTPIVDVFDSSTSDTFRAANYTTTAVKDAADNTTTQALKSDPYAKIHQGVVSREQFERCNIIINLILKPIVCIGGIIMNIIGFCVLLQKQFRRSTYTYLCFLALSDIFLLLASLIRIIPQFVKYFNDIIANRMDMYLYPYNTIFLATAFTRITEFCICALAIERFFAVLFPLKVKELFLCRHAFGVCVGIWVFCFLAHFHFLFVCYPKPYFNPSRNITMWTLGRKSWYFDSYIKLVYDIVFQIIFLYGPIVVLVTCNIGILIRVRQINRDRHNIVANDAKSEKMSNDEKRITMTLLIISLTFLSVFVPVVMMTLFTKFYKEFKLYGREHYLMSMLIDIVGFGSNVSSANDFIVYIYTSKQFKQALLDMVCRSKGKKMQSFSQGSYTTESQCVTTATEAA